MLLLMFAGGTAANTAPVVDAGPPSVIGTTGVALSLAGSVTDDGLPSGTLTSLWTVDSGPGVPTFVDATDPTTDVTCPTAGTYVLRLTGDDTALTAFDTITLLIADPPSGTDTFAKWFFRLWH